MAAFYAHRGPRYAVEKILYAPGLLLGHVAIEPESQLQRCWALTSVQFLRHDTRTGRLLRYDISPERYNKFYQTILGASQLRGMESHFAGRGVATFELFLTPQGKVAADRCGGYRQQLQLSADGETFRIELPGGGWAYFAQPGVREEALRLL